MSELTKEQTALIESLEKECWELFHGRGDFSHNIISINLNKISDISKEHADSLYQELIAKGF